MLMLRAFFFLLFLAAVFCAHAGANPVKESGFQNPAITFDLMQMLIPTGSGTLKLEVEVASTNAQRAQGLMERTHLPADAGMLFIWPEMRPPHAGFWMFRTRIPLEIAFLDAEGRIVAILAMEPCKSPYPFSCPIHTPGVPYRAALEVNPGFYSRHQLGIGSRLDLPRAY